MSRDNVIQGLLLFFLLCSNVATIAGNSAKTEVERNIGHGTKVETLPPVRSDCQGGIEEIVNVVETSVSFRGWRGESAVFRREDILENSKIQTSYFSQLADGVLRHLCPKEWQSEKTIEVPDDPPLLKEGKILVFDYQEKHIYPKVLFRVQEDSKMLSALDEALMSWQPGRPLPSVSAKLSLEVVKQKGGNTIPLWQTSRLLSVSVGETGLIYVPPSLEFAALSPSGLTLLIRLVGIGEPEYLLFSMNNARSDTSFVFPYRLSGIYLATHYFLEGKNQVCEVGI